MPAAEARVRTENPGRYLARLCRHAARMNAGLLRGRPAHRPRGHADGSAPPEILSAQSSGTQGTLVLNGGRCTLRAADGVLTLRAEADDQDRLSQLTGLIAGRLEKLGRREGLTVSWEPVPAA